MDPEVELEVPVTTAAETGEEVDSSGDIWGDLDQAFDLEFDDGTAPQVSESAVPEVPEAAVPSEPAVPEAPVVEQPPAVAEAPVVAAPETPAVEQPPLQPPVQPTQEHLAAVRQQYQSQLAASYALDEATAEAVDTNMSAVLPQLASTLHMRIAESVTQTLGQMLPQLISSQLQYMQVAQQNNQQFFGEWPELNKPEYQNTIVQVAQMYRQLKPQASPEQFIRDVGIQAWTALGLPVERLLTRGQQAQAAPVAPPAVDLGGYAPATPGAPARSQRLTQQSDNWFTQAAEEILNDDY